ncbi:IS3 family transposase [Acidovorax sp. NPDC077693]|uniref:IS3 family transposase n=1 Tax=unclassified Acidovorax TaxID=2684926 RepID=UPI0037C89284
MPTKVATTRCSPSDARAKRLEQSMIRKGNCFNNAVIESFFGTLKAEYLHLAAPTSIDALEAREPPYVHYYNQERIKLRLNGFSLVGYRLRNTT